MEDTINCSMCHKRTNSYQVVCPACLDVFIIEISKSRKRKLIELLIKWNEKHADDNTIMFNIFGLFKRDVLRYQSLKDGIKENKEKLKKLIL